MCFLAVILTAGIAIAQDFIASDGTCGTDVAWSFDGKTLTITNVSKKEFFLTMNDYDTQKMISHWYLRTAMSKPSAGELSSTASVL